MVETAARALQRSLGKLGSGRTGRDSDYYISSGVQVRSDDVGGRGIYATRDLSEGEELLRIPHSGLVTAAVGQSYPAGRLLKQVADDVDAGADWPLGVVVKAFPGEKAPDFPNEETYVVLALVLEDAMRRHATSESDASVHAALLANDSKGQSPTELTFDQARRQLYYAALPTMEELRQSHPLFMVSDLEPEPEQPASVQAPNHQHSVPPPVPAAVRTAIASCGLALGEGPAATAATGAAEAVAAEYWSAVVSMRQAVVSEYCTLCCILGREFATSHSAEEWLYCWAMVMSRNFLLQIGDPALGGGMTISGLVPFADLMNHAHSPSVSWSWDSGSGQFVMQVETSCGDGVAEGEELTINYSPGHSGQDPRNQHPPFYFGVFYGFLERQTPDSRVFPKSPVDPLERRLRHNL